MNSKITQALLFAGEGHQQRRKNHGGLARQDYLSAIDDINKEKYVDTARRGCVGASYGGYPVFFLAAIHNSRFKTFIAHDGIFDFRRCTVPRKNYFLWIGIMEVPIGTPKM